MSYGTLFLCNLSFSKYLNYLTNIRKSPETTDYLHLTSVVSQGLRMSPVTEDNYTLRTQDSDYSG